MRIFLMPTSSTYCGLLKDINAKKAAQERPWKNAMVLHANSTRPIMKAIIYICRLNT